MSTYAIGDIQGCFNQLMDLLTLINFDPNTDQLWLAGDLINRGPNSLEVLRFLSQLKPAPIVVLGNHDLHLLAVWQGSAAYKPQDTFQDILAAPDRDELCEWLRQQKMLHYDPNFHCVLVHAGLAPNWDLTTALRLTAELEAVLHSDNYAPFLAHMYGNEPNQWHEELTGWDRLRVITNYLTRVRFCTPTGALNSTYKKGLDTAPTDLIPWFKFPHHRDPTLNIVFGHWAALEGKTNDSHLFAIDTGCVWGKALTALRLEDQRRFTVRCTATFS